MTGRKATRERSQISEIQEANFCVGETVSVLWTRGNGGMFIGEITSQDTRTNTFSVIYEDGWVEDGITYDRLNKIAQSVFSIGDVVNVRWDRGDGGFFVGQIDAYDRATNTYSIEYTDGWNEDNVTLDRIQLLGNENASSSKQSLEETMLPSKKRRKVPEKTATGLTPAKQKEKKEKLKKKSGSSPNDHEAALPSHQSPQDSSMDQKNLCTEPTKPDDIMENLQNHQSSQIEKTDTQVHDDSNVSLAPRGDVLDDAQNHQPVLSSNCEKDQNNLCTEPTKPDGIMENSQSHQSSLIEITAADQNNLCTEPTKPDVIMENSQKHQSSLVEKTAAQVQDDSLISLAPRGDVLEDVQNHQPVLSSNCEQDQEEACTGASLPVLIAEDPQIQQVFVRADDAKEQEESCTAASLPILTTEGPQIQQVAHNAKDQKICCAEPTQSEDDEDIHIIPNEKSYEDLERENRDLRKEVNKLKNKVASREEEIVVLQQKINKLESRSPPVQRDNA